MNTVALALTVLFAYTTTPENASLAIAPQHLIAYYSFNNCDATDDTGQGSDGALYGGVGCRCGVEDDGLYLNGVDAYVEFSGRVNQYFTTSDFTLSFYFRPGQFSFCFSQSLISKRSECDEYHMLDLRYNWSLQRIDTDFFESPYKYFKEISPDFDSTTWLHYALVREGSRAYTYINGTLRHSAYRCSGVDIGNQTNLSISNSPCTRGGRAIPFRGVIDELRVYDKALTEEEILALYQLHPVETAELDCLVDATQKSTPDLANPVESGYLCANLNLQDKAKL